MKNSLSLNDVYLPEMGIIGLVTTQRPYKLAWRINQRLNTELVKEEDLFIPTDQEDLQIIGYSASKEYGIPRLLKNRCINPEQHAKPFLLPEYKAFDFFFILEGVGNEALIEDAFKKLKALEVVTFARHISTNDIKTIENLLF